MDLEKLPEVRLECLDEDSAEAVMKWVATVPPERLGNNSARREGRVIVIAYSNKMWPYDLADMAGELGFAGDAESAAVFACL